MYATRSALAYQRVDVESADPRRLVVMLFEAAVRFLYQAREAMARRDYEKQCGAIIRVQDILSELTCALDPDAGEIAGQLRALYSYIYGQLVEANLHDDLELLGAIAGQVEQMRDAWAEAERQQSRRLSPL
jgi:flagellar secretion chaperone FliS